MAAAVGESASGLGADQCADIDRQTDAVPPRRPRHVLVAGAPQQQAGEEDDHRCGQERARDVRVQGQHVKRPAT